MNLPNVLLIGAMKSGTTGLYMDLASHPDVFLAQDKEPHNLCSDEVLTHDGRQEYAALYGKAAEGQIICDASTRYTKRPDEDGVVERALEVLPEGFKVIYLVRHPVKRIISQHYHEYSLGLADKDAESEVRQHSRYLNYSSYAYQLQPWLEAVGPERILVIRYEDYVAQQREVIEQVCEFLNLAPNACQIEQKTVYNNSKSRVVPNSFWKGVAKNPLYRKAVRKLLPPKLRLKIFQWVLPSAPEKPAEPTEETLSWLHETLVDEVLQLSELLGIEEPLWPDFANLKPQTVAVNSKPSIAPPMGLGRSTAVSQ